MLTIVKKEVLPVAGYYRLTYVYLHPVTGLPVRWHRTPWERNQIPVSGLNFLASLLANEKTNNCAAHIALGTGTTATTATDTKLQTEGFRKAASSRKRVAGVGQFRLRTFLTGTEAIGTWTEIGVFFEGTGVADTGTLWSRWLPTGGINKSTTNIVLTVEHRAAIAWAGA